ncbi:MAG: hypothetical protein HND40_06550 [Ignavibacteriota bacterium]|jgi:superfamily II DNA or RNA helicase|nr:hypothetical protein [Ignavibacteriota bacterium]MCO6447161.1 hypothetical protein [Ignavibacterium album]QKJ99239.1 MAG: hypothetical protein HND40_06550 [Ignavibacteriota bacterium]GIK61816.1 MAG: hypothetical protein BroJett017_27060 [Ignavibacteriota bacterium]HOJ07227.1 helicase-related protein [Ignavibacteriaceae bacterium]
MSYSYSFENNIDLFVKDRISFEDAKRQMATTREILMRLENQPGLILADEVGMGKTFIALAVAVSIALQDSQKRPVVVMVPTSLRDKWPKDFNLFKEKCLPLNLSNKLTYGFSDKAVDFLKFLDDPKERMKSIVFLTHGAMSRGLTDGWVKLAIIKRALFNRKDTRLLKKALSRILGDLLFLKWATKDENMWIDLLESHTEKWLNIIRDYGVDPEGDNDSSSDDDPVPEAITKVLEELPTIYFEELYQAICNIPKKSSPYLNERIKTTRAILNENIRDIWEKTVRSLSVKLPLLILDEAHHLKNARTRLASLFNTEDSIEDADEFSKGSLSGIFERMLFLTATPFQLGHHELCSVLDRFSGISWSGQRSPSITLTEYKTEIDELRSRLDKTQVSSLRLESAWSRMQIKSNNSIDVDTWWDRILDKGNKDPDIDDLIQKIEDVKSSVKNAEILLKKYVIRHNKSKYLPGDFANVKRRENLIGKAILDDITSSDEIDGLSIKDNCILPFLLASRAAVLNAAARPVFAEGLASSYEAFLNTRKSKVTTDSDDEEISIDNYNEWYHSNIEKYISTELQNSSEITHPKVSATVKKAVELWMKGEKVLIFCHYIATGKSLRQYISYSLNKYIQEEAAKKLGCDLSETEKRLDNIGKRFSTKDSQFMLAFENEMNTMIKNYHSIKKHKDDVIEIIKRYIRTPSFLIRFFPLDMQERFSKETLLEAMGNKDLSGITLRETILDFFNFLENKCGVNEREKYIGALLDIQTGNILSADARKFLMDDEIQNERTELLIPNVRLVNGDTKSETRQNLMLTFNTPFYPDILITSSVLAEGVDLHLNCRFIIHHDLSWNPSTLEQRTGRIDRIGSKTERSGKSINVFIPYVSETQDEKMYRVVMDREKWFKIVMGDNYKADVKSTDKISERIPLPSKLTEELAFNLEI